MTSDEAKQALREHTAATAGVTKAYLEAGEVALDLYRKVVYTTVAEKFPGTKITIRKLLGAIDSRVPDEFERKLTAAAQQADQFGEITIDPDSLNVRFFAK